MNILMRRPSIQLHELVSYVSYVSYHTLNINQRHIEKTNLTHT